jgi:D-amino-acid dehydrogenase
MVPVIGKSECRQGLWFAVGHTRYGFSSRPVTGRLHAERITGEEPFTAPLRSDGSGFEQMAGN